jgi:hypothetical protein
MESAFIQQTGATGYIVHWGVKENQLNNAAMVFNNQLEAGYYNRDSEYYFSVDAFNENGLTSGQTIVEGAVYYGEPYNGTVHSVPGTIEAEDFNEGGQNYGYFDTTMGNRYLKYRPREYVDINENRTSFNGRKPCHYF